MRWCNECNVPKLLRTHHCRVCRVCVELMDHRQSRTQMEQKPALATRDCARAGSLLCICWLTDLDMCCVRFSFVLFRPSQTVPSQATVWA
jgi:hypothetical protein